MGCSAQARRAPLNDELSDDTDTETVLLLVAMKRGNPGKVRWIHFF